MAAVNPGSTVQEMYPMGDLNDECAMPASVVASFVGYVDYDAPSGLVIDHNLELVTATKITLRLKASDLGWFTKVHLWGIHRDVFHSTNCR